MFLFGVSDAKTRRRRRCATKAGLDPTIRLFHADPAQAMVMAYIGELVANGEANWDMLDNADIELRFNTGQTFLLTGNGIIRLA